MQLISTKCHINDRFIVTINVAQFVFICCQKKILCVLSNENSAYLINNFSSSYSIELETVTNNKAKFSKREIAEADLAGGLIAQLGYPPVPQLLSTLSLGLLPFTSVTSLHVLRYNEIYGVHAATAIGRTVHRKSIYSTSPTANSKMKNAYRFIFCPISVFNYGFDSSTYNSCQTCCKQINTSNQRSSFSYFRQN